MCKLCNTDKPAIKTIRKTSSKFRKEIAATVYDYLGEYACSTCITSLSNSCKSPTASIDHLILLKLYHAYRSFTGKKLWRVKSSMRVIRKSVLGCTITIYTRENGTTAVSYTAAVRVPGKDKRIYGKPKPTFEEMINDKIALIKMYKNEAALDLFLRSIERYNQKLKESQNEQN